MFKIIKRFFWELFFAPGDIVKSETVPDSDQIKKVTELIREICSMFRYDFSEVMASLLMTGPSTARLSDIRRTPHYGAFVINLMQANGYLTEKEINRMMYNDTEKQHMFIEFKKRTF